MTPLNTIPKYMKIISGTKIAFRSLHLFTHKHRGGTSGAVSTAASSIDPAGGESDSEFLPLEGHSDSENSAR
jgi:hypothetical protein